MDQQGRETDDETNDVDEAVEGGREPEAKAPEERDDEESEDECKDEDNDEQEKRQDDDNEQEPEETDDEHHERKEGANEKREVTADLQDMKDAADEEEKKQQDKAERLSQDGTGEEDLDECGYTEKESHSDHEKVAKRLKLSTEVVSGVATPIRSGMGRSKTTCDDKSEGATEAVAPASSEKGESARKSKRDVHRSEEESLMASKKSRTSCESLRRSQRVSLKKSASESVAVEAPAVMWLWLFGWLDG